MPGYFNILLGTRILKYPKFGKLYTLLQILHTFYHFPPLFRLFSLLFSNLGKGAVLLGVSPPPHKKIRLMIDILAMLVQIMVLFSAGLLGVFTFTLTQGCSTAGRW